MNNVYLINTTPINQDLVWKNNLNLSLVLEQILLLVFNPEYNVLKVAGSPAGIKRDPVTMLPSFLKTSKVTYVYDDIAKKNFFSTSSLTELAKLLNLDVSNLSKLIIKNSLYLNRIIFSNKLLSESDYILEIVSPEELINYIDELRQEWMIYIQNNMDKIRVSGSNKRYKRVELTNIENKEVLVFESLNKTANYLKSLGGKFSQAGPGVLTSNISKGNLYKGIYKVKYI